MAIFVAQLFACALSKLSSPSIGLLAGRCVLRIVSLAFASTLIAVAGSLSASATIYYIDNSVPASGNGLSWGQAWKSFSRVEWPKIQPGDTIYISGGTSGQMYRESLKVGASGKPDMPIVIARATKSDRDGPVIVDGDNIVPQCVVIDEQDYVEVRGLTVRNCTDAGFEIRNAHEIVVRSSSVYALSRGFHIWRTSSVLISGNSVDTPQWTLRQTDGIYSQENSGNRYVRNRIVISNGEPTGHDDGIQSYRDREMVISRNYVEQRNPKRSNALGIFVVDASGTIAAINNIVYGPNTYNGLLSLLNESGTDGALLAYNNTLVGSKWGIIQLQAAPKSRIVNNILYTMAENGAGITFVSGPLPSPLNLDYNLYFTPNGSPGYIVDGEAYSWANWRDLGYERKGVLAPRDSKDTIIDGNFAPTASSPAIDRGKKLSAVTRDYAGRQRPLGWGYDIGTYEGTYRATSGKAITDRTAIRKTSEAGLPFGFDAHL
jgi:hypothetical protein